MPVTRANLSTAEQRNLLLHLEKHKIYPFRYRIAKTINATNFATADGALGSYLTYVFTPDNHLGIVMVHCQFIILPNTTVGAFSVIMSYNSTITLADNASPTVPDDEGNDFYELTTNGGAINDFQVYYPLTWYLEARKPIYIHVWADATTVTAGTSSIRGHIILGTLLTGAK